MVKVLANLYPALTGALAAISIATLIAVLAATSSASAAQKKVAFFEVGFKGKKDTFVIKLRDKQRILQARTLLQKKKPKSVMGRIVKAKVGYNKRWSYHLQPASVSFFEVATEVCDASPAMVEKHLKEAGAAFLPSRYWCPWSSYLRREVHK